MAAVSIGLEEITCYFDDLEDPRSTVNQKHPLVSVVVIAMMAVLAGAGGPTAIAKWAKLKAEFLMRVWRCRTAFHAKTFFGVCCRCSKRMLFKTSLWVGFKG